MSSLATMDYGTIAAAARGLAWLAAGALLGAAYFGSLRWNIRLLAGGRLLLPVGLQLVRFAGVAAPLALLARAFGALPLLLATVGLLMARTAVIRRGWP